MRILKIILPVMLISSLPAAPRITVPVTTGFATYSPLMVTLVPDSAANQFSVAENFINVHNYSRFNFSVEEEALLRANGFVVTPAQEPAYAHFHNLYARIKEDEQLCFISVDALLHSFHILYDYALRDMETGHFAGDLKELDRVLFDRQDNLLLQETLYPNDAFVRQALYGNKAYLSVALTQLDSGFSVDSDMDSLVSRECAFIAGHDGFHESPIFGYREDYSQYVPRGHYTRTRLLSDYFRAMMWHGRMQFKVGDQDLLSVLQALYICRSVLTQTVNGKPALEVWDAIYEPTAFFVGRSDDLNIRQYAAVAAEVWGAPLPRIDPGLLADSTKLLTFVDELGKLPGPRISTTTDMPGDTTLFQRSFRFMGQRFIPDSYILDQVVYDRIPDSRRTMPRGLDVLAVLGSERAFEILDQRYNETEYAGYAATINSLQDEFDTLAADQWAENLYWNWLYTLLPLLEEKPAGYPPFMRTAAWADKTLATASGSWAELRHDTILYAKQSGSATSGYPSEYYLPATGGYVEPEPACFARMAALARYMLDGFTARSLLSAEITGKLESFESLCRVLQAVAEKELAAAQLTLDEVNTINIFAEKLKEITAFGNNEWEGDADSSMAVIADVHTDPNSRSVLEVGVGHPQVISVIVKIGDYLYVTRGGVFAYYEFTHPMDDRLTDEAWQTMLKRASPPAAADWTDGFTAGSGGRIHSVQDYWFRDIYHFIPFDVVPAVYQGIRDIPDRTGSAGGWQVICTPNPAGVAAGIRFANPRSSAATVVIRDNRGILVRMFENVYGDEVRWEPGSLPDGTYLVSVRLDGGVRLGKFTVNR